jgi:outer membrane lipase/esterase
MWGGANDIFTYAALAGGGFITSTQAQQFTGLSAQTMGGLVGTLQAAGANYIVVFNLPDIGATPQAAAQGAAAAASLSGLTLIYNGTLDAVIGTLGDGIIPINVYGLFNEIIANPGEYGFTNITGTACGTLSGSLACGPAGDPNYFYHYASGTNSTYLFADGVHPTGAAHAMLASVVYSTIVAPGQVSLAPETSLAVYDDHARSINGYLFRGKTSAEVGETQLFANAQFSQQDFNAAPNTMQAENDLFTATFGLDYRMSESMSIGAAASLGASNGDFAIGGGIESRELLASIFATWHIGGGYINAIASAGSNSLDIDRLLYLGPSIRRESGSTNARHYGFELGGGYVFDAGGIQHGPFISGTWQRVEMDGYSEETNNSTSMWFGDVERESLVGRVGYQLSGLGKFGDTGVRPYLRVAYASESEDDVTRVQAGSTSLNGHFTMNGFQPGDEWYEAEAGISFDFGERGEMLVSYQGRFSDDSQDRSGVNLSYRYNFGSTPEPTPEPVAEAPAQTCADLDDDGDGVNNCDDKCPNSAAGQAVGPDGCAVPLTIDLRGVNFDFDKDTLRPDSIAILDEAAAILTRYPELRVEVAGHTDECGADGYNQNLSERRAKVVFEYLTGKGIDGNRLSGPSGYGESRPLEQLGDAYPGCKSERNRRTELNVQN